MAGAGPPILSGGFIPKRTLTTTLENEMEFDSPMERRKAVFAALVAAQDEGNPVKTSRALVAGRNGLTVEEVETIEKEGLMRQWPPLA